uniref:Uncharacterized protein n=1 Tax=Anguilla anguilla TaxID=7936 RepID=A0A0E9S875_ANGAN
MQWNDRMYKKVFYQNKAVFFSFWKFLIKNNNNKNKHNPFSAKMLNNSTKSCFLISCNS